jgi:hypothetical protein
MAAEPEIKARKRDVGDMRKSKLRKEGLLFRKKEAKNFYSPAMASHYPGHGWRVKVFWFFFSKKNILTCLTLS